MDIKVEKLKKELAKSMEKIARETKEKEVYIRPRQKGLYEDSIR